ncbi:hypothetical protein [uncultured Nostoc sp.]|uniref:hypothetical protein n=1 Tax=uncultured Nostoc sp. TaxID=340711 RepID=UPI00261596BE|nr:hypothetical protein [uncultured Nostoc sp.]
MPQDLNANEAQSQAKIALYIAAKEAAEVVSSAFDLSRVQEDYHDKNNASIYSTGDKRIEVALEVLRIAWASK